MNEVKGGKGTASSARGWNVCKPTISEVNLETVWGGKGDRQRQGAAFEGEAITKRYSVTLSLALWTRAAKIDIQDQVMKWDGEK